MSDPTEDEAASVEDGGIAVSKSFSNDEFPVPAVVFELESDRDDPATVRIVDAIPESFPMDRVGFHPDYESDGWTAYNDHRVEFERVLEPGETVTTVYGIREDDPDADAFLGTPTVEAVPEGEEMDEVLGADGAEVVRDVLGGERSSLPGMDEPEPATAAGSGDADAPPQDAVATASETESEADPLAEIGVDDEGDATDRSPEPRATPDETTAVISDHDPTTESAADAAPEAATEPGESSDEQAAEPAADEAESADAAADAETVPSDGIAAALAAEIRRGAVDDDDLDLLREELDVGTPASVDVRIGRLQSRMEDLAAYADALESFIDEEGTADGVLADLHDTVGSIEDALSGLEERADAASADRDAIADDVAAIEESVADVREQVETVADDLTETDASVDAVEAHAETIDDELGDVWEDIAEMDGRLVDVEERVEETVGDTDASIDALESEIDRIDEELEELEEFRDRLSDAFGA